LDCKSFRPSKVVMIKWPVSSHEPYRSELSAFCHGYSSIDLDASPSRFITVRVKEPTK
jgi:hypothetical protein